MVAFASRAEPHTWQLVEEIVPGGLISVVVPYAALRLERLRVFSATVAYQPLNAFASGCSCSSSASRPGSR